MNNDEWIKLEVSQVFETIRTFLTLQVQMLSVLMVADVTIIGFGISQQSTGPFVLGAIVSISTLTFLFAFDSQIMSPLYYRAMSLRAKIGEGNFDFFPIFFGTFYYPELPGKFEAIEKIHDYKKKAIILRRVFVNWKAKRYFFIGTASILQLLLVPILILFFGWKFP